MPDEVVPQIDAGDDGGRKRFSVLGMVLAAGAAIIFVGGTLLSVLTADESTPEQERERPSLASLMDDAELVVRGTATSITRVGEPRDAGALATISVDRVITPTDEAAEEIRVYDHGFRESWLQGQQMLLFLNVEGSLPEGAEFRVLDRCVLEDRAVPCPFAEEDIERLAGE